MCHMITGTLPKDAVGSLLPGDGSLFRVAPVRGPSARHAADDEQYVVLVNGCACGTVLGCRRSRGVPAEDVRVAKWRKKGWSEAKIQRALGDATAAAERGRAQHHAEGTARAAEAQAWVDAIRGVVAQTGSFGVLLHWYSGSVDDEDIALAGTERIPVDQLDVDKILDLEEDVLYRFVER